MPSGIPWLPRSCDAPFLMRKTLAFLGLGAVVLLAWAVFQLRPPPSVDAVADDFVLTDVTLIQPTIERIEGATIWVRGGTIRRVDRAPVDTVVFPDLSGSYVLPGLVDMHAHLPPDTPLKLTGYYALLFLAHGVTTIRDAGDTDGTAVPAARAGIESGAFVGPRIESCGPFVAGAEPRRWPNTEIVERLEDAEPIVERLAKAGHSCVKAYEDLSVEKIAALKEAAEKHGLKVMGHVPAQLEYAEAGVPDVQHFFGVPPKRSLRRDHVLNRTADWQAVDDAYLDEVVAVTLAQGLINTPTLVSTHKLLLYGDYDAAKQEPDVLLLPRIFPEVVWNPVDGIPYWAEVDDFLPDLRDAAEKKRDLVGRLYRAGATLQLGTDSQQPFVVPGASLQQEMALFVESGIPVEEVWAMATWKQGGRLIDGLGTLDDGAPADFLVFRRDPTEDLEALDSLEAVVAQGRIYLRADIDRVVERYREHFRGGLVDAISLPIARSKVKSSVLRNY